MACEYCTPGDTHCPICRPALTDLEKAEIVLSILRNERECIFCHVMFPSNELVRFSYAPGNRGPAVCRQCWLRVMPPHPIIRTDVS